MRSYVSVVLTETTRLLQRVLQMNKTDTEILNEIISIIKSPGFDENIMYDICELLKRYGKM